LNSESQNIPLDNCFSNHSRSRISNASTATLDIDFRGDFGYAVASFFDDDGDQAELEDATFEAVHYGCYAYGMVEDLAGSDMPEESGYLISL